MEPTEGGLMLSELKEKLTGLGERLATLRGYL
jgi:hypothetical protein